MFLLILIKTDESGNVVYFKFHYVSINSKAGIDVKIVQRLTLNSIMFLLILKQMNYYDRFQMTLNSIMFLLIHGRKRS